MSAPFPTIAPGTLPAAIRKACARHGIAPSRFGRDALRDPCLVSDLANGRTVTQRTVDRVRAHLATLEAAC